MILYSQNRHRPPTRFLLILVLAFATDVPTAWALDQSQLDAQRALWNSYGFADYNYVMQRDCFCVPESVRPGVVAVRNGAIASVADADTMQPLDPALYHTINGLFDRLQNGLDANAFDIMATFDPQFGYPSFYRIDFNQFIVDEEEIIRARDFAPVPETTAGMLLLMGAAFVVRIRHRRLKQRGNEATATACRPSAHSPRHENCFHK